MAQYLPFISHGRSLQHLVFVIFGKQFGNYPQDIILRLRYR